MAALNCAQIFHGSRLADVAEKGPALEAGFREMLLNIPGIFDVESNILDVFASEEIDLVVWNDRFVDGLGFLPEIFLVECKHWTKPVASREITLFAAKLEKRSCAFGILVAAQGITGDAHERTNANAAIADALAKKVRIVVFRLDELEAIQSTEEFISAIKRKIMRLTGERGQV